MANASKVTTAVNQKLEKHAQFLDMLTRMNASVDETIANLPTQATATTKPAASE